VAEGLGFSAFGLRFSLLLLTWPLAMTASFRGGDAKLGSVAANRKRGVRRNQWWTRRRFGGRRRVEYFEAKSTNTLSHRIAVTIG
jgi:hypothetical protein